MIWTATGALGIGDLPGGELYSHAWGISDDGLVIVGYGRNPQGRTEAWLAVVPNPHRARLLALGTLADRRFWMKVTAQAGRS